MLITRLIRKCNQGHIASDYLRAPEIYEYMDKVIIDINSRLSAKFPLISDWVDYVTDYNAENPDIPLAQDNYSAIPDLYLSMVVPVGTARYYYMKDEEGETVAMDYLREYEKNLYVVARSYAMEVPDIYRNEDGGVYDFPDVGGFTRDGFDY